CRCGFCRDVRPSVSGGARAAAIRADRDGLARAGRRRRRGAAASAALGGGRARDQGRPLSHAARQAALRFRAGRVIAAMALEKATITRLRTNEQIAVMFNPAEYTFDVANSFAEIAVPGRRTPPVQYVRGNGRTLKMELFFDTYEARADVRAMTL